MIRIPINNANEVREELAKFKNSLKEFIDKIGCDFEYTIHCGTGVIQIYPYFGFGGSAISVYLPEVQFHSNTFTSSEVNWCACGSVAPLQAEYFGKCLVTASKISDAINRHLDEFVDIVMEENSQV